MYSKAARLHNKGYKQKSEKKLFHKTVSAQLEICSHFNLENMLARDENMTNLYWQVRDPCSYHPTTHDLTEKKQKAKCHTYISL